MTSYQSRLTEADKKIASLKEKAEKATGDEKVKLEVKLKEATGKREALAKKVYVMKDCMSAVAVPDASHKGQFIFDFTPQAEDALRRFADAGMHVVDSTQPLPDWPDIKL